MSTIKPFAALRPNKELAQSICTLPYDVMNRAEAKEMASGKPESFLHVSRPEIDLDDQVDAYDDSVYETGAKNFRRMIDEGLLVQDDKPCYYLYRQIMGDHSQIGLVAVASCQEYRDGIVKKHELTRPVKENDRVRHIESLNSQTGPVFLTYRANAELDALIQKVVEGSPDIDFTTEDKVQHTSWVISDQPTIERIESLFRGDIESLYIADGHHRSAAGSRVDEARQGAGQSHSFLSVLFPHNQMQILPYNRAIKDLNGLSPAQLIEKLEGPFVIDPNGDASPNKQHQIGCYIAGQWYSLEFREAFTRSEDPIDRLDVTLLQNFVLSPLLGIDDPRTSDRIDFVGGIRGTGELEKMVDSGKWVCAFSMFPTSIESLMEISDQGGLMPPKSTWFEPKLRDAMFSHLI